MPMIAMAMFVSQASAENFCMWSEAGDCWEIPASDGQAKIDNCGTSGWLFTGNKGEVQEGENPGTYCAGGTFVKGKTNTPPQSGSVGAPIGCCKWSTEANCSLIYTTSAETSCKSGGNVYWAGSGLCSEKETDGLYTCPSGTPTYNGQESSCNAYCYWNANAETGGAAGCFLIVAEDGKTCTNQISSCQQHGGKDADGSNAYFTSESACRSANGLSPILKVNQAMGLIVATHDRALHISSDKNATVTLYTLAGQKVLSGVVHAGNSVFSLMNQNPGVYYAVVQSGSYTQTLNVVLK
ncbi:MAG: T9SS type A sorting domain-containing protein [Fibromonadales bacterium]|nr:T9SS type A sorting domain-containing protein [Fibromonadales bacterium]